ncbi:MAG: DUF4249 domain-containing protein [Cyclobacteriaceae bacterium]|nr:DUF4249 domain-containing protein [Cyclobacteriaceae bacterium]
MKALSKYVLAISSIFALWSCEDNIDVELPQAEAVVVIDAWINDKPEPQTIKVMKSISYFENTFLPGLNNATITVEDLDDGYVYAFEKSGEDGTYIWEPDANKSKFGTIQHSYKLTVDLGTARYESFATMNRVPPIDSITFRFEKGNSFFPDSYFAGVYATDPLGPGDAYWIKAWKNGEYLNKPSEINISYDAGGSPGALVDGLVLIQPIRDGINPFDQDENDEFLSPYAPGDSVFVEIHSINFDAYTFLNEVIVQTDRPGGFGELFAQPLANVSSNISLDEDTPGSAKVVGMFSVSAVSAMGQSLDPDNLPVAKE